MNHLIIDVMGWAGGILILASYILLSMGLIEGRSRLYQWMNVLGAVGFVINSGSKGALPSATLNIIWTVVGLYTLWQISHKN